MGIHVYLKCDAQVQGCGPAGENDEQTLTNRPSDIYAAPGSMQIYQGTSTFDFTAGHHGNLADKRNSKRQRSYVPNPFEPAVAQP